MTNITLIGGSGFVGTRLIELLKDEYQIRNIDKRESHFHNDITVTGDVRDQASVSRHLAGAGLVVLLAAEHRDDVSPVSLYYDVNVGGMRNVLEAMETNGVKQSFLPVRSPCTDSTKRIRTKITRPILSTITAKANGRRSRYFGNGMKRIPTGISIS